MENQKVKDKRYIEIEKRFTERSSKDKLVCVILEYHNQYGVEYYKELWLK